MPDFDKCPIEWLRFNRRQHAYFVKLYEESKAMRWSGASNWGKQIESTNNLERWKVVSVLTGAANEPQLLRKFAHANERDEQDDVIEQLLTAAKANEGRDFGSDAHRVTERADKGLDVLEDEWSVNILAKWRGALEAADIRIEPSLVERIVVVPSMRVCGTFDRLAWYKDELHVIDLKTGSSALRYPHSMTVQLALLARAEWITDGEGERKGDSVTWTTFARPPQVNKERGLIVWLDRGAA